MHFNIEYGDSDTYMIVAIQDTEYMIQHVLGQEKGRKRIPARIWKRFVPIYMII